MKCILFEQGKCAKIIETSTDLDNLRNLIDCEYPDYSRFWSDPVLIVFDENGKIKGNQKPNRLLFDESGHYIDVIYGNFIICGYGEDDFGDIPEQLIDKYYTMYYKPNIAEGK